ncbi:MAG: hypothetical protein ACUVUE_08580, partial [Candidatus Bathycorpusculaceae bacterium]
NNQNTLYRRPQVTLTRINNRSLSVRNEQLLVAQDFYDFFRYIRRPLLIHPNDKLNHQPRLSRESMESHKNFLPLAMDTISYGGFQWTVSKPIPQLQKCSPEV